MATDTYQGALNQPTLIACTWFVSDRASYQFAHDVLRRSCDDEQVANELRDWLRDNNPLSEAASPYVDLLLWALSLVDYHEVVKHLRAELDEEEDVRR
jgi:GrpB-like predicted nucleotidyltransferase (UPF0157 family)